MSIVHRSLHAAFAVLDRPQLAIGLALLLFLAFALSGCATLQSVEPIGHPDTFAKCAAADVVTTTIGLATNTMMEGNPLVRALAIPALGRVAGTVVPLIGLSVAAYYLLKHINEPAITATAAVLTCAAALHNTYLIAR